MSYAVCRKQVFYDRLLCSACSVEFRGNPDSVINNAKKKKKMQVTSHCSNDSGAISPLWPFRLLLPPNSILLGTHFSTWFFLTGFFSTLNSF